MNKKIYISTGEKSGEIHASTLCKKIKEEENSIKISAMGGEILRKSGVDIFYDASNLSVTGFTEIIKNIFTFKEILRKCVEHIIEQNYDAVIMVDYPGFNMRLAKLIKEKKPEQKIYYYICPKFWAWNYRRVKKIKKYIDHIFCIFPFEPPMLEKEGISSSFIGNPLLDQIDFNDTGNEIKNMFPKKIIGLFPGSRKNEIKRILPVIIDATKIIKNKIPDIGIIVGAPQGISKEQLEKIANCKLDNIKFIEGKSHKIMAGCDFIIAKSGTTTLETALIGTPMVAVYLISPISAFIGKLLLRTKHFTLPNLLTYDFCPTEAERYTAVPEMLQKEANPKNIANKSIEFLTNENLQKDTREKLINIRKILGNSGASMVCAKELLSRI